MSDPLTADQLADLVERLRVITASGIAKGIYTVRTIHAAADAIEALEARIEAARALLRDDMSACVPVEPPDPCSVCSFNLTVLAALNGDTHD